MALLLRLRYILIILYIGCSQLVLAQKNTLSDTSAIKQKCATILNTLWETLGKKEDISLEFVMFNDEKCNHGAYTIKSKNTIHLEKCAYEIICDSIVQNAIDSNVLDNALAFILAHELIHLTSEHDYSHLITNNDWSQLDHVIQVQYQEEEFEADVNAIFLAYQAGYDALSIADTTLSTIYRSIFQSKKLSPLVAQRLEKLDSAKQKAKELIDIFEYANLCVILQQYETASQLYSYILKTYKGSEIYINIAVTLMLEAVGDDSYKYPFILDDYIKINLGTLSDEDEIDIKLVEEALDTLTLAEISYPNNELIKYNKALAFILLGNFDKAQFEFLSLKKLQINNEVLNKNINSLEQLIYKSIQKNKKYPSLIPKELSVQINNSETTIFLPKIQDWVLVDKSIFSLQSQVKSTEQYTPTDKLFIKKLDFEGLQIVQINHSKSKSSTPLTLAITDEHYQYTSKNGLKRGMNKTDIEAIYGSGAKVTTTQSGEYIRYIHKGIIIRMKNERVYSWIIYNH